MSLPNLVVESIHNVLSQVFSQYGKHLYPVAIVRNLGFVNINQIGVVLEIVFYTSQCSADAHDMLKDLYRQDITHQYNKDLTRLVSPYLLTVFYKCVDPILIDSSGCVIMSQV